MMAFWAHVFWIPWSSHGMTGVVKPRDDGDWNLKCFELIHSIVFRPYFLDPVVKPRDDEDWNFSRVIGRSNVFGCGSLV